MDVRDVEVLVRESERRRLDQEMSDLLNMRWAMCTDADAFSAHLEALRTARASIDGRDVVIVSDNWADLKKRRKGKG